MATQYTYAAGRIYLDKHASETKRDRLDAGFYTVKQDPMTGEFYLEGEKAVTLPARLYDNVQKKSERILKTFHDRNNSTGVLLTGLKGTGKTVLAKKVCVDSGLPVLLLTTPYFGEAFSKFIASIDQPAVIMVDEFEKIYGDEGNNDDDYPSGTKKQEHLLSLLDGVFSGKKLWLLTTNSERNVSEFLFNRPGRIFYRFNFRGLDKLFIEQFCQDHLKDFGKGKDEHIKDIVLLSKVHNKMSIDILISLIEEMNRYEEGVSEVLKYLNILLDFDTRFDCQIMIGERLARTCYTYTHPMMNVDEMWVNYGGDAFNVKWDKDNPVAINDDWTEMVFEGIKTTDTDIDDDDENSERSQEPITIQFNLSKAQEDGHDALGKILNRNGKPRGVRNEIK